MICRIRICYPAAAGDRIVLRSDRDWGRDVAPVAVAPDRHTWDFELPTPGGGLYYKPCLVNGAGLHWPPGWNYRASPRRTSEIYPHFFGGMRGEVQGTFEVAADDGRAGRIGVYLPPGYAENTLKRYPVLYMQDGANLYGDGRVDWRVDESMDVLDAMNGIDKAIVVGIQPLGDRDVDFTAPGNVAYGRWVVERVIPWVDARYRTLPLRTERALVGSSLGGLVSLYLAWQYPQTFAGVAALSATLSMGPEVVARIAADPHRELMIYLDSGFPHDNSQDVRALYDLLVQEGFVYGVNLLYFLIPDAKHEEGAWALRWHLPFQFLFRKRVR